MYLLYSGKRTVERSHKKPELTVTLMPTMSACKFVSTTIVILFIPFSISPLQLSCEALSSYLTSTLNPYITNVTTAAQLCSDFLCRGNGRCVRKNYKSSHYLHLNPESFRVVNTQKHYFVLGSPSLADLKSLSRKFNCQCYKGLKCTPRTYKELAKALMFSVKRGQYQNSHTLSKVGLDDTEQASTAKDKVNKNFNAADN